MRNRCIEIINVINQDTIDLPKLHLLTFTGVPACLKSLRLIVWRLLMDGLPTAPADWEQRCEQNFETYENFKKELIVNPKLKDE